MNIKKIILFISIISSILIMTNCTPTVDNDTYNFEFRDSTKYLSAYVTGKNAIFSYSDYRCKGQKNGSQFMDSTFKNISLLFKTNEDLDWMFVKNIGTYDSIFYVSSLWEDSIVINIDNSMHKIFFEDATTLIDSFDYALYPNTIDFITVQDSTTVSLIDSTNSAHNTAHKSYSDWKKGILQMYY